MAFAFHDIILNGIPVTYSAGRITLNGSGLAYASEAAGSVTGLTVESGDARYVNITGNETVLGVKTFTGSVIAQDGLVSSGNIQMQKGNPRLQFRDTSAGGHSQGFDIHVDTGRFYIDDNTYNSIFFDYGSNGNNNTLKLAANQLSFYTSPSGSTPQIALLIDTGRNTRVSGNLYVSGVLLDSAGNQTIDPKNYYLLSNGIISLDWTERSASSNDGTIALSWTDRVLLDTSENASVSWGGRQLSGDWLANTNPTTSGHIINKGYLDSITGSLGGGVGSDVVRTTGVQNIYGQKVFYKTYENIDYEIIDSKSLDVYNRELLAETYSDTFSKYHTGVVFGWQSGLLGWSEITLYENYDFPRFSLESGVLYRYTSPNSYPSINLDTMRLIDGSDTKLDWSLSRLITTGTSSVDWGNRLLYSDAGSQSANWNSKALYGNWSTDTSPTASNHLVNKSYVDSNSSFTLGFGHKMVSPADSTTSTSTHYYFGGIWDETPTTTQSDTSVVYVPTSGILRNIVGNCYVQGTLASSEDVYLVVSVNGSDVATGTYKMTGRNNIIQSGLQSINRNLSKYDSIQMRFSGSWATNPINIRHNLNAYITLG